MISSLPHSPISLPLTLISASLQFHPHLTGNVSRIATASSQRWSSEPPGNDNGIIKTKTQALEDYGPLSNLEGNTGGTSSSSAVVWSFSGRLDLEPPVVPLKRDVLNAGRVGPPLKELPLVATKLEQVTDDHIDLQREVTCLDVTETFIYPSYFLFHPTLPTLTGAA